MKFGFKIDKTVFKEYNLINKKGKDEGMEQIIQDLTKKFNINGQYLGYEVFTSGHINTTCKVRFLEDGQIKEYVLQKINKYVFKKPDEVMQNIVNVTTFIKNKLEQKGENSCGRVLNFCKAQNNEYYVIDDNGDYWRLYEFVSNSIAYDGTSNLKVLEETGRAFGEFQYFLADFPIEKLNIIIPEFHNTKNRYQIFKQTVKNDPKDRVKEVKKEIKGYLDMEPTATIMQQLLESGALSLRVTHNDTKCNNVLFNPKTHEHMCVIDLDTVMPGLIGFDFGDAIRFAANTAAEDEINLSNVKIDLNRFRAFAEGFLAEVQDTLSEKELKTLSLGAITMTAECGVRFLTDYIDGDNYFKINYPKHNLDRARCQLALAQDMLKNYSQMQEIIEEVYKKNKRAKSVSKKTTKGVGERSSKIK